MNYREIVAEAWHFTQENRRLAIWYGAVPAFFSTVVGIGYIVYQYYAFLSSKLFLNWERSFLSLLITHGLDFLQQHREVVLPLIVTAVIMLLGYFVIPVICEGALIQLIARRKNGQNVPGKTGLRYGLLSFLPLFEYRLLIQTFSIFSILSTMGMALRNLGWGIMNTLVPIMIFILLVALVTALFLNYAEYYIVIDGEGVFSSISKSFGLVVKHLEETLLLTVLMLIIGVRIIIQLLFVLLIPAVAIGAVYLFATANLPTLGVGLGAGLGVIGLIVAAYLNGIIHTFAVAVWTFTFLKLTSEVESHARDQGEK